MKKHFKKFQKEEMIHHDKEAQFYASRNEDDYIWEVPAEKYLLSPQYIHENQTIVDMGCGPSIFTKRMIKRMKLKNIKYIGVDISGEMLKIAKINIPNGIFIQDDMETVKLKKNSVNVIISLGALHHSEHKVKTLARWISFLTQGGYILLREPTKESLKKGQGESPNEEGIDLNEVVVFARQKNISVEKVIFFWSPVFHIINRVLIKLGFGNWRKSKILWFLLLQLDTTAIKFLRSIGVHANGDTVAMVLKKI